MTNKLQMTNYKWQIQRAFTLIELLVVISIVGILIGLSVFGLQGARQSSRDAVRKADLETIRSGLAFYKADCGTYPASLNLSSSTTLVGNGSSASCLNTNVYITTTPVDPLSPNSAYSYYSPDGVTYKICASMEQTPSPLPDISNCGNCGGSGCNYVVTNP